MVFALALVPLLGAGAIAIDVGALYAERAQLQNGVDAAALAVAAACANNESNCGGTAGTTAQRYVDENAAIVRDPAANTPNINYADNTVTVTAATDVDHVLAQLLGADSSVVTASGSAEWGQPVAGSTLPLAIGVCEFDQYPPLDPTAPPSKILVQYNTTARAGCDETYAPGGFGWLDAADCIANLDVSGGAVWHKGDRGNNLSKSGCDADTDIAPLRGTTVLIPIYDSYKKVNSTCSEANIASGGTVCLRIAKFAAFVLTGFKLSGSSAYVDSGAPRCTGSCRGLQGYFVKYVSVDEAFELGDGDPEGLSVVRMIITPDELADLTN
ncbi:pilus assembly protein TadG-related protein [Agromyces endophyticus]|uniref:Tad domain-containing protein n=1 Tax=Agromyces sp. H17E-10 TaxID=2932244 RepID=UPI001FD51F62|nr:pilus assembly protein TadG-related protein [Agromyces sp. H17E-10]UOQ90595.1 pilus assembly protein TadG-related protein [Agromyces sp. H17E-10]